MSAKSNSMLERKWDTGFSPSVQVLRQWTAPRLILAVTNFDDEEILLFHAIRQARQSLARVLLVHVLQTGYVPPDITKSIQLVERGSLAESALASLNRMARQLRWIGISCEPLLLRGSPAKVVASIAKARRADRVLIARSYEEGTKDAIPRTLAEDVLSEIEVPVCIVGQRLPLPVSNQLFGNITLALSLHADAALPLAFASRLAQEHQAKLTVMHVFRSGDTGKRGIEQTPSSVASQLSANGLREAELFCPVEIAVRKGDPAEEILRSASCANQNFIVLGPVGVQAQSQNTLHRIIREALCPIIVLGQSIGGAASATG